MTIEEIYTLAAPLDFERVMELVRIGKRKGGRIKRSWWPLGLHYRHPSPNNPAGQEHAAWYFKGGRYAMYELPPEMAYSVWITGCLDWLREYGFEMPDQHLCLADMVAHCRACAEKERYKVRFVGGPRDGQEEITSERQPFVFGWDGDKYYSYSPEGGQVVDGVLSIPVSYGEKREPANETH